MTDNPDSSALQANGEKALRPWYSNPDNYLKGLVLGLSLTSAYMSFNQALLNSRVERCVRAQTTNSAECKGLAPEIAKHKAAIERRKAEDAAQLKKEQEAIASTTPTPVPAPSYTSPEPVLSDRDTVAANILAVACGNQVGLVAYDAIGGQLKGLLESDGINPEEVYSNWDYYYSRAKEMDAIKGYGCIR